ncbi:rRNA maturation RNase YbeY [Pedobacter arcticus]|uniref:rRNA maturation RNase YbeY n=1 Tax=Pedobacter arcticus TaxID=752140 RepID=UPI0002FA2012|nr:rRNA maturation RNase YbeY [Pedobacter arcticus]
MSTIAINFFSEETTFKPTQVTLLRNWLLINIKTEGYELLELNFIFCSDDYLLNINREYLNHDTYTDTVTFDNSETENDILGDIFISIDRIRENAKTFKTSVKDELHRVMIHSTLHLLGYKDKTTKDKTTMTAKENEYLALRGF